MKYVKIFKNIHNGGLCHFEYNAAETNYYSYVKGIINEGFQQCSITSDLMINIADRFALGYGGLVTKVEFLQDDEDFTEEINTVIKKQSFNRAYWSQLKERLIFLNDEESIDIKSIVITGKKDKPYQVRLFVNGIVGFECGDEEAEDILNNVIKALEAYIR